MRPPAMLALIAAASFAASPARSDDQSPLARVRVDVQMVSVSVAQARQLVLALQDRHTASAAWTHLQEMIGDGEAKLVAWPVVWLQSGSRSVAESIVEQRFSTEPMPPQGFVGFMLPPPSFPTWGPFTPSAFETRNVGPTLEVAATVQPGGQVIDLNFVSQIVRLAGTREWRSQKSPIGAFSLQQQPIFQTTKVSTQMCVHRDEPVLAGVFVLAEPEPHVELHILHARATLLPPSAPTFPTSAP